jgi:hypothetical protein
VTSSAEHTSPRPEAAADTEAFDRRLHGALAVLNGVFLAALGFAGGIVLGLCASWTSWLWLTGTVGRVLGVVTVLLFLAVLFSGTRAVGWATGAKWGPGTFAAGWLLAGVALTGYSSGGDVLVTSAVPNYLFLYGGVGAVILGTVLTPETGREVTRDARTSAPS